MIAFKKYTLHTVPQGLGINNINSNIINSNILHGVPITELFWVLLFCKSDSWRRCTCTNVLLVYEGEVGELVQPGGM